MEIDKIGKYPNTTKCHKHKSSIESLFLISSAVSFGTYKNNMLYINLRLKMVVWCEYQIGKIPSFSVSSPFTRYDSRSSLDHCFVYFVFLPFFVGIFYTFRFENYFLFGIMPG